MPLLVGDGAYLAQREEHLGPLHHTGGTLLVEETHQRLARLEAHDSLVGLEGRVGTEGVGGGTHGFLVLGGVGTQGMLHAVAQLPQDVLRYVGGALRDEVDAHPLGTYQADDLFNLVHQRLAGVFEEHVRLVEEEDEPRKLLVAHLGQGAVELAHQPQQEGAV